MIKPYLSKVYFDLLKLNFTIKILKLLIISYTNFNIIFTFKAKLKLRQDLSLKNFDSFQFIFFTKLLRTADGVAEWLRRWTANPLCSARVGSNPISVVFCNLELVFCEIFSSLCLLDVFILKHFKYLNLSERRLK